MAIARLLSIRFTIMLVLAAAVVAPPVGQWFDRIFIVVMENTDPTLVLANSYFASLAEGGTLLTDVSASGRPSQPNYISLLAGSMLTVTSNIDVNLTETCIIDKFEAFGVTWKAYMEDFPSECYTGTVSGKYARRHNPFISFDNIRMNSTLCAKIVAGTQLQTDLDGAEPMPMYAFYTPNNNNNGHDTNVTYAATWMDGFLTPLLSHSKFANTLVVITWDEGTVSTTANKIITILRGMASIAGLNDSRPSSHYGLVRTIEDNWSLGDQGRLDASASSFLPIPTSIPTTTQPLATGTRTQSTTASGTSTSTTASVTTPSTTTTTSSSTASTPSTAPGITTTAPGTATTPSSGNTQPASSAASLTASVALIFGSIIALSTL